MTPPVRRGRAPPPAQNDPPPVERLKKALVDASPSTVERYSHVARAFLEYSSGRMTRDCVLAYLAALRDEQMSAGYRRYCRAVLRRLFELNDLPDPIPAKEKPPQGPVHRPYYTIEEVEAILEAAKAMGPREYALLRVAAATGCRRDELRRMVRTDYRRGNIYIQASKGGAPTVRPLDPNTQQALDAYLKTRTDKESPLFLGNRGELSHAMLSRIFAQACEKARVRREHAGLHALRRGFVTLLHNKLGMSLKQVQDLGGWKDPKMVLLYAQLEEGESQKAIQKVHPWFRKG